MNKPTLTMLLCLSVCCGSQNGSSSAALRIPLDAALIASEVEDECLNPLSPNRAGYPCRCASDCDKSLCLTETAFGFSHGICVEQCGSATDCGSGYICDGSCQLSCKVEADCPAHNFCIESQCFPQCTIDDPCDFGTCNTWSGLCGDAEPEPEQGGVEAQCLNDSDCKSDICVKPRGYCATFCSLERPSCPDQATCYNVDGTASTGLCTNEAR
jgi:hypothetical protein